MSGGIGNPRKIALSFVRTFVRTCPELFFGVSGLMSERAKMMSGMSGLLKSK